MGIKKIKVLVYDNILQLIAKYCKNLEYLHVTSYNVKLEGLCDVCKNGKLLYLNINTSYDIDIQNISSCTELRYVILNVSFIKSIDFKNILKCKLLKTINIGYAILYDKDFENIFTQCPLLQNIKIPKNITDIDWIVLLNVIYYKVLIYFIVI